MTKIGLLLFAVTFFFGTTATAETWSRAVVVDKMCSAKAKSDPDAHTRACALQCKDSGFGVVTDKGEFLAFDKTGNEQMVAALNASKQKDHLRADITGTREGDTIRVEKLSLQ
jgi:hypothetical protein